MPASDADTSRSPDRQPTTESSTTTVLLADDDDAFRETLVLWLADTQWETLSAESGEDALSKLDGNVDVLVLDRRMPDLSGPEVIDRLDDTEFDGSVVVLSAFKPDDHLSDDDAAAYLTKPVDSETFVDAIAKVV